MSFVRNALTFQLPSEPPAPDAKFRRWSGDIVPATSVSVQKRLPLLLEFFEKRNQARVSPEGNASSSSSIVVHRAQQLNLPSSPERTYTLLLPCDYSKAKEAAFHLARSRLLLKPVAFFTLSFEDTLVITVWCSQTTPLSIQERPASLKIEEIVDSEPPVPENPLRAQVNEDTSSQSSFILINDDEESDSNSNEEEELKATSPFPENAVHEYASQPSEADGELDSISASERSSQESRADIEAAVPSHSAQPTFSQRPFSKVEMIALTILGAALGGLIGWSGAGLYQGAAFMSTVSLSHTLAIGILTTSTIGVIGLTGYVFLKHKKANQNLS